MIKLLKFLKGYRLKTILGPIFKLIEAILELLVPVVVAAIIDDAIPLGKEGDYSLLWRYGIIMFALAAVGWLFALVAQFFASRASMGFGTNVRRALYSHINGLSQDSVDRFGAPSLLTRLVADTAQVQQGIAMFIRLVMRTPFIVIGSIVMAMIIDVKMSVIFIAVSVVISLVLYFIMTGTFGKYIEARRRLDDVSLSVRENLSGARVVRAFSKSDREIRAFDGKNRDLTDISVKIGNIGNLLGPATFVLINIAVIAVLWLGGKQVYYGSLTQGQIIALTNYLTQIMTALIVLANLVVTFSKASASAKRINEVLDTPTEPSGGTGATADFSAPAVCLKNVDFSYGGSQSDTLSEISLSIDKGQTVGIVGGTGSGKSTLVQLIAGLYKTERGTVQLFGNDVSSYTAAQKNAMIGFAMQKSALFSGTIRDNLAWRKPSASDAEITDALRTAQAYDFVFTKQGGLDYVLSEGGKNLSGGQRQRLNIARALVGKPEILILDDSSSALDFATDAALRAALGKDCRDMTIIVISQRATSMRNMDRIFVMDDGQIVGQGTHAQLAATCEQYREIYNSQVTEEDRV